MAVLPFRPTPFFANKNRAFWNLQFAGWTGAVMLRSIQGISNGQSASYVILMLIVGITGFAISTLLSVVYRKLINRPALITWGATAAVLAVAVGIYAVI
ncbi:MAG: sensor histidine kinase, partial [Erythrobacter sp.]|nr:sensor histidine kinase [Erythrobacter sp.]